MELTPENIGNIGVDVQQASFLVTFSVAVCILAGVFEYRAFSCKRKGFI